MEVEHVSLTPQILVEHALLRMQIRGCRCAVMNLPDDLVRALALMLLSGMKAGAALAELRRRDSLGPVVKLSESQVKWFARSFRKAAEHVRRAIFQASTAGEPAAPMQLSRTVQEASESRRVRLARQRAACVEQLRRARGTPRPGWLDQTVTELRQMFPALRISRTTIYRWDRVYQDAETDLPKLLDARGGDQRTAIGRMLRRRSGGDNSHPKKVGAGRKGAPSADLSRRPRPN